ncbi:Protein NOI4 [Linum grandiflorum]
MADQEGRPLPKFGEWDVNDPASAEGFSVIFNKARNDKKSAAANPDSPATRRNATKNKRQSATLGKPHSKKWLCCIQGVDAD